ncbi:hypothetical protein L596_004271 [Steinernema carpocapsae]|uniref:Uncharacterized protein n=1 Tax=Steinernema carpocapsae TaxID=34508 RepID=A0A4U8UYU2_STECR|nr:hypothetical protein L596_004271 [Steinernema carpocapsae]
MMAMSPRPDYENEHIGCRWIILHETDSSNEPMIVMASAEGLACLRDFTLISILHSSLVRTINFLGHVSSQDPRIFLLKLFLCCCC